MSVSFFSRSKYAKYSVFICVWVWQLITRTFMNRFPRNLLDITNNKISRCISSYFFHFFCQWPSGKVKYKRYIFVETNIKSDRYMAEDFSVVYGSIAMKISCVWLHEECLDVPFLTFWNVCPINPCGRSKFKMLFLGHFQIQPQFAFLFAAILDLFTVGCQ